MISDNSSTFSGRESNIPKFFAGGRFQSVSGDLLVISQTSVILIMGKVLKAIAAKYLKFINFPTPNEIPTAK